MTFTKYWFARAVGSWRGFWGFCPDCNSKASLYDRCQICKGSRDRSNESVKLWKARFRNRLDTKRALAKTNKQIHRMKEQEGEKT